MLITNSFYEHFNYTVIIIQKNERKKIREWSELPVNLLAVSKVQQSSMKTYKIRTQRSKKKPM